MRSFFLCILTYLHLSISCQALIVETSDISQLLCHATDNSLYVFDLDNTLIEPSQHLGSDQWVGHTIERGIEQGLSGQEAIKKALLSLEEIYQRTEMQLVDPAIPDLLHQLKKKKIPSIGLTKRDPLFSHKTLEQLERLHIAFQPAGALESEYTFKKLNGTIYNKGVIFVAGNTSKGSSLVAYLKKLDKTPSQIIAIDDKMSNILDIEAALKPLKIAFVGIRYSKTDAKVKAFNPQIADLQLKHMNKILSDEEALHLLQLSGITP